MVRVVTQEAFEEIVKENIDDLEMEPAEALQDAVAQLEAQGVDLSYIIKDLNLGPDGHPVCVSVKNLKELASKDDNEHDKIIEELKVLKKECTRGMEYRVRAAKDGAYQPLIDLLDNSVTKYIQEPIAEDEEIIKNVVTCLTALMNSQPDLLEGKGLELIKSILDNIKNDDILLATLKWTNMCCVKHEMNRQKLFANNIGDNLKNLLSSANSKVVSEDLSVMRKFTLDDDVRVEFGKAHDHAKEFGFNMLETLTDLLKENTKPPKVSDLLLTIASLLVRHELCKLVADRDIHVLFSILTDNYDNVGVTVQAAKLITALAGHDDVKRDLVKTGIVPIIVALLNRHAHNPLAASLILKCIAALTLREPEHSRLFLESGAPAAVVATVQRHPDNSDVQKNACYAIRNMVGRCRDYNHKFKELGIEPLLNLAFEKYNKDFGFDIKSALRDLECDVKLDEQWTGKGVQMEQ